LAVYSNDGQGGFKRLTGAPFEAPAVQDQTAILTWHEAEKPAHVLIAFANYEDGQGTSSRVEEYQADAKALVAGLTNQSSSIGALALGDMDGEGNLELFVGGRVIANRYPEAASSQLYKRVTGVWQLDQPNAHILEKVGLVSGAVWSDLDGDGFAELILACEWGPIKIFRNDHGQLRPWNPPVESENHQRSTLNDFTGWWNGVTTGDLDGDGRLDIIVSNWGLNTPYHATPEQPARLYYGDFSGNGTVDLIEAEYDPALKTVTPRRIRDRVAEAYPEILSRFSTHKAYSTASIADVLGSHQTNAIEVRATCLASVVLLNRTNHFEVQVLPAEAQFAPAFSVNVADFDGDGHEDVFLSQNFFANQPEVPRYDAGRGLLLRGDGTGRLKPMPGQESGIKIYGEQRGAAVADFDKDGRPDLVVAQNAAATKLYRNVNAKPGLRVRLIGPPGNPDGTGAQMRLFFGERAGPVRETHAGSGYWSQDSIVTVLSLPAPPARIWVRWPGGKETTSPIPEHAKEISVDLEGKLLIRR
jgi:hypothetical protein